MIFREKARNLTKMIAISEKILGMLTYWERDDLLIKKLK